MSLKTQKKTKMRSLDLDRKDYLLIPIVMILLLSAFASLVLGFFQIMEHFVKNQILGWVVLGVLWLIFFGLVLFINYRISRRNKKQQEES